MADTTALTALTDEPAWSDATLGDLIGDTWFTAQHDVLAVTGRSALTAEPAPVTGAFDAYDVWAGDLSEVHAFLTAHPAF